MFIKYLPELDDIVQKRIKEISPEKRNGNQDTMYGYKMQDVIVDYLLKREGFEILQFLGIKESSHLETIMTGQKLKQNYTSTQVNIIIKTINKQVIPIFFRTGKANYIGAYECGGEDFLTLFDKFLVRNHYNCFKDNKLFPAFFCECGMNVHKAKSMDSAIVKRFEKNIHRDWKSFVQFVFQASDKKPRAKFFMFYDRERKVLFVSTLEEYIDMLEKYHVRGTFKTRMKWSRTKTGKIKFKIANPVWLLDGKRHMPFWNMPIEEKVVCKNNMRAKQGKSPYIPVKVKDRWM